MKKRAGSQAMHSLTMHSSRKSRDNRRARSRGADAVLLEESRNRSRARAPARAPSRARAP
eukprot:9386605-Alexandrium_andersonii.AAC.1